MRKSILILFFSISIIGLGQSKKEVMDVMNSNDTRVISSFIKKYPNHKSVFSLKRRLASLITKKEKYTEVALESKNTIKSEKIDNNQTVDILNHLLNNNSNSQQVYLRFKNLSKCDISVLFEGNKNYTLNVSSNSLGRILLDKGEYKISSKVCNVNYKENRNIIKDMEISLNIN